MFQLKVILILILAVVLVHSSNTTFRLVISRNQDSNIITLTCRNDQPGVELQRATFFLNSSELNPQNYPTFSDQNDESGMVTFQINRQLEGMYSCGTGPGQGRSTNRSLIGKHNSNYSEFCGVAS